MLPLLAESVAYAVRRRAWLAAAALAAATGLILGGYLAVRGIKSGHFSKTAAVVSYVAGVTVLTLLAVFFIAMVNQVYPPGGSG